MIKGLTDRGQAFPQIGNIRKGDKGGKNGAPRDLDHFRVEFDERETDAAAKFAAAYGAQPKEISILLPFDNIEQCWDAWCEAYVAGRMIARSDGETFSYLVDFETGAVLVQNGASVETGEPVPHKDVLGKTAKSVIRCRPVGRLRVIIPDLQRFAYLVVHTTSVIDIRNISQQLEAIKAINNGQIIGVPLVLKRRPQEVSVPKPDGSRSRMTKHMLSIEADPRWVQAKLAQLDTLALPGMVERPALPAVVEDVDEGDWDADIDSTPEPESALEAAIELGGQAKEVAPPPPPPPPPTTTTTTTTTANLQRPLSPQALQGVINTKAGNYALANKIATPAQRNTLAILLGMVFADMSQPDQVRRSVQKWLTGYSDIADMDGTQVLAMLDWLGNKSEPSEYARDEAMFVWRQALEDAGQLKFDLVTDQPDLESVFVEPA